MRLNKRIIKIECRKAFQSKNFIIVLCIGMLFAMMSALYDIGSYDTFINDSLKYGDNPDLQIAILYNNWMGGEGVSLGSSLFFTLLPLLAAIPYGISFCNEKRNGYLKNIAVRCKKDEYYTGKYIATFLSGAFTVIIPLIASIRKWCMMLRSRFETLIRRKTRTPTWICVPINFMQVISVWILTKLCMIFQILICRNLGLWPLCFVPGQKWNCTCHFIFSHQAI